MAGLTATITIEAPVEQVMDAIAGFADYPRWVEAVQSTEIIDPGAAGRARRVRFVVDAGVVADDYVLDYTWSVDGRSVSWQLVESELQQSQAGCYRLLPQGEGTEVHYDIAITVRVAMMGQFRRKAEKRIMGSALTELKRYVEQGY